ncbi:MAG TPA: DUF5317 family protein [Mycobacteriales bacterium]|nr:DUF5317 family protein [Mycobacteriales bacterium]
MAFALVVLTVALVAGRLAGGRVRALGRLPLRGGRLLAAAVALQAGAQVLAATAAEGSRAAVLPARGLLLAAFVVTGLVVAANARLPGAPLAGVGLALNALVVAANGGVMPVSARALEHLAARDDALLVSVVRDPLHEIADGHTRVPVVADVIPVPLPWRSHVASPGDLLLTAGLGLLVVEGMLLGRPGRPGAAASGRGRHRDPTQRSTCEDAPNRARPECAGGPGGEEVPQAARPRQAQGQPRQAAERLTPPR